MSNKSSNEIKTWANHKKRINRVTKHKPTKTISLIKFSEILENNRKNNRSCRYQLRVTNDRKLNETYNVHRSHKKQWIFIKSETTEILRNNNKVDNNDGWKLHLSFDGRKPEQLKLARDIIFTILTKCGVNHFKFFDHDNSNKYKYTNETKYEHDKEMRTQVGKEVAIYAKDNPEFKEEDWERVMKLVSDHLNQAGITPGFSVNGDERINQYFYRRTDRCVNGEYMNAINTRTMAIICEENESNPFANFDRFTKNGRKIAIKEMENVAKHSMQQKDKDYFIQSKERLKKMKNPKSSENGIKEVSLRKKKYLDPSVTIINHSNDVKQFDKDRELARYSNNQVKPFAKLLAKNITNQTNIKTILACDLRMLDTKLLLKILKRVLNKKLKNNQLDIKTFIEAIFEEFDYQSVILPLISSLSAGSALDRIVNHLISKNKDTNVFKGNILPIFAFGDDIAKTVLYNYAAKKCNVSNKEYVKKNMGRILKQIGKTPNNNVIIKDVFAKFFRDGNIEAINFMIDNDKRHPITGDDMLMVANELFKDNGVDAIILTSFVKTLSACWQADSDVHGNFIKLVNKTNGLDKLLSIDNGMEVIAEFLVDNKIVKDKTILEMFLYNMNHHQLAKLLINVAKHKYAKCDDLEAIIKMAKKIWQPNCFLTAVNTALEKQGKNLEEAVENSLDKMELRKMDYYSDYFSEETSSISTDTEEEQKEEKKSKPTKLSESRNTKFSRSNTKYTTLLLDSFNKAIDISFVINEQGFIVTFKNSKAAKEFNTKYSEGNDNFVYFDRDNNTVFVGMNKMVQIAMQTCDKKHALGINNSVRRELLSNKKTVELPKEIGRKYALSNL